ncbi:cell division control protein 6-like protein [Halosimplex carlsbadense 2-9-1]|uniref:Cell division control protein 6-like protein n=1 Tax=Halosimplex carlsbadense 2-9-1 TaxID=797114 RepID=M0CLW9_9EURY|nr:AAA family ATPase [Halosimplex carlsbadense]ELZ24246.1 cell division control protein 6-like protein [Halosimplex carlsbadense 2-9-1]
MNIDARIKRRQRRTDGRRLVEDYESLSPVAHPEEPSDRGPTLERLLDHLDPVFDGNLPGNAYVFGPFGAGKSAVVTALFSHLDNLSTETRSIIHTSTRAATPTSPAFAYVDLRETTSEFAFYHAVLDALVEESVPDHGISTADLRERLHDLLGGSRTGVVVVVDHVGEPEGTGDEQLVDRFAGLPSNVSWLAVGRRDPEDVLLTEYTATEIRVDRYRRQTLVDLLMTRASLGLAHQGIDHELARRVAEWADGNAHDAMTALFVAAVRATEDGRARLTEADVTAAVEEVPRESVSLGRVLALPANKQLVLRELVDLDPENRASVTATTEAIGAVPTVDLSPGTVKRYLYEMAEVGIVERVQSEVTNEQGRPPSRVELRFSPTAFRRLYDLRQ